MTGVSKDEAQKIGGKILNARGWLFVPEGAEWRHPDGRQGRMCYFPDHEADFYGSIIKAVKLQFPGSNGLVGGFMDVWDVEKDDLSRIVEVAADVIATCETDDLDYSEFVTMFFSELNTRGYVLIHEDALTDRDNREVDKYVVNFR